MTISWGVEAGHKKRKRGRGEEGERGGRRNEDKPSDAGTRRRGGTGKERVVVNPETEPEPEPEPEPESEPEPDPEPDPEPEPGCKGTRQCGVRRKTV